MKPKRNRSESDWPLVAALLAPAAAMCGGLLFHEGLAVRRRRRAAIAAGRAYARGEGAQLLELGPAKRGRR